ncbi:MAG: hypothetical protein H6721_20125 [Sandaracinus sp.]|nr:hypothetical protein [Myxococcales bacterium]MCB9604405.1 hypothetical protein [Sandaracinus sp.]MCB9617533.1 hypothetical protein [Sandaracinus sp.]MCB9634436.1 hypothetical protein [Sandaracinus sp.]
MRVAVALPLVLACGAGEPLEGDWEVFAYEVSEPCDGDALPATPAPTDVSFRLVRETFFDAPLLAYYECSAPGICAEIPSLVRSGAPDGEGGYRGALASASGDPCAWSYRVRRFERDEDTLVITRDEHGEPVPEGGVCDAREAERRGESMPCVRRERWYASRPLLP